ncbi:MAG: 1-(5-phosphoribosyl)-5-[(5-phosphoribosylamino)methylideneamino]imidazole-4-carboxamide isomerase [Acidimicrobiales bacterium]
MSGRRPALGGPGVTLYPAIDLRGGRCVRLLRGDYDAETVYGDDPAGTARGFVAAGAEVIHVVDLDAARSGEAGNAAAIASICDAVNVPVQVGGGVRSVAAADALFDLGVARVVVGTAAVERPELVEELVAAGRSVAVGLDARGDEVASHGWTRSTGHTVDDLARRFAQVGVDALVVTEIGRDGTLDGPDVSGLAAVLEATAPWGTAVVASGGVGSLDDLSVLGLLVAGGRRLDGAIVGRAIYENVVTVTDAVGVLSAADRAAGGGSGR